MKKRVLATGTFDILHPGHLYFLEQAKALGDELYVLVARDSMIKHKDRPIVPEHQRIEMISALKLVDHALPGSEKDIFEPLEAIQPDIIALGYDQVFDDKRLQNDLQERGFKAQVIRLGHSRKFPLYSSGRIITEILKRKSTNP